MKNRQHEVVSVRYPGFFDNFNMAKAIDQEDFFLIAGTHILPRENLRQVLIEGSEALLEYNGSSDLIVQIKG